MGRLVGTDDTDGGRLPCLELVDTNLAEVKKMLTFTISCFNKFCNSGRIQIILEIKGTIFSKNLHLKQKR